MNEKPCREHKCLKAFKELKAHKDLVDFKALWVLKAQRDPLDRKACKDSKALQDPEEEAQLQEDPTLKCSTMSMEPWEDHQTLSLMCPRVGSESEPQLLPSRLTSLDPGGLGVL